MLGSLQQAMKFYEEALRFDVFCAEAYEKLIKKHMFTPEEGITEKSRFIEYKMIFRFFLKKSSRTKINGTHDYRETM